MLVSKPWLPLALVVCATLSSACNCHCEPETEFLLPALDARVGQSVQVRFHRADAAEPQITCTWGEPDTGGDPVWSCAEEGKPAIVDSNPSGATFVFPVADFRSDWAIELEGPGGAQTLSRTPSDMDPGEGWPTSCTCYPYSVGISSDELRAVGATLR
jgi:hypothetical protein